MCAIHCTNVKAVAVATLQRQRLMQSTPRKVNGLSPHVKKDVRGLHVHCSKREYESKGRQQQRQTHTMLVPLLCYILLTTSVAGLDNAVARLPPLGLGSCTCCLAFQSAVPPCAMSMLNSEMCLTQSSCAKFALIFFSTQAPTPFLSTQILGRCRHKINTRFASTKRVSRSLC